MCCGVNGEWLCDVIKYKRLVFNVCETVLRCDGMFEGVFKCLMDGVL